MRADCERRGREAAKQGALTLLADENDAWGALSRELDEAREGAPITRSRE